MTHLKSDCSGMYSVHISKESGLTVKAKNACFKKVVDEIFIKWSEIENKSIPIVEYSDELKKKRVAFNIIELQSRSGVFKAIEAAGNCQMIVSKKGSVIRFE